MTTLQVGSIVTPQLGTPVRTHARGNQHALELVWWQCRYCEVLGLELDECCQTIAHLQAIGGSEEAWWRAEGLKVLSDEEVKEHQAEINEQCSTRTELPRHFVDASLKRAEMYDQCPACRQGIPTKEADWRTIVEVLNPGDSVAVGEARWWRGRVCEATEIQGQNTHIRPLYSHRDIWWPTTALRILTGKARADILALEKCSKKENNVEEDLRYFRDNLFNALKVPAEFLLKNPHEKFGYQVGDTIKLREPIPESQCERLKDCMGCFGSVIAVLYDGNVLLVDFAKGKDQGRVVEVPAAIVCLYPRETVPVEQPADTIIPTKEQAQATKISVLHKVPQLTTPTPDGHLLRANDIVELLDYPELHPPFKKYVSQRSHVKHVVEETQEAVVYFDSCFISIPATHLKWVGYQSAKHKIDEALQPEVPYIGDEVETLPWPCDCFITKIQPPGQIGIVTDCALEDGEDLVHLRCYKAMLGSGYSEFWWSKAHVKKRAKITDWKPNIVAPPTKSVCLITVGRFEQQVTCAKCNKDYPQSAILATQNCPHCGWRPGRCKKCNGLLVPRYLPGGPDPKYPAPLYYCQDCGERE